jgi:signal transduction histidine kinase
MEGRAQNENTESAGHSDGGVAHDLNNLLAIISGFAELLQHSFATGSAEASHVESIRVAAARATRLMRQLLHEGGVVGNAAPGSAQVAPHGSER